MRKCHDALLLFGSGQGEVVGIQLPEVSFEINAPNEMLVMSQEKRCTFPVQFIARYKDL